MNQTNLKRRHLIESKLFLAVVCVVLGAILNPVCELLIGKFFGQVPSTPSKSTSTFQTMVLQNKTVEPLLLNIPV